MSKKDIFEHNNPVYNISANPLNLMEPWEKLKATIKYDELINVYKTYKKLGLNIDFINHMLFLAWADEPVGLIVKSLNNMKEKRNKIMSALNTATEEMFYLPDAEMRIGILDRKLIKQLLTIKEESNTCFGEFIKKFELYKKLSFTSKGCKGGRPPKGFRNEAIIHLFIYFRMLKYSRESTIGRIETLLEIIGRPIKDTTIMDIITPDKGKLPNKS